ncbi:hypothetical protein J6590_017494 [Homalodisca vitripennis]|nr:hypothetical protein J6590_017494 [Homalodisca vitripennis]
MKTKRNDCDRIMMGESPLRASPSVWRVHWGADRSSLITDQNSIIRYKHIAHLSRNARNLAVTAGRVCQCQLPDVLKGRPGDYAPRWAGGGLSPPDTCDWQLMTCIRIGSLPLALLTGH